MKTITKEINLYNFEELNEKIQERLIEERAEEMLNFYIDYDLEEYMNEQAEMILEDNKIYGAYNVKTYYDLSYSQGSGAMIEFTTTLKDLQERNNFLNEEAVKIIEEEYHKLEDINVYVKHNGGDYYHEMAFKLDFDPCIDNYKIEAIIYNFLETRFKEVVIEMNRELKQVGYACIEDIEWHKQGAYEFYINEDTLYLEDGSVYDEM